MLTIPTAVQEREREHGVPLDTPNKQLDRNAPRLHSDAGRMGGQNVGGCEDQGTAIGGLSAVTPERTFNNDQLGESRGERQDPGNIIFINLC